MIISGIAFSAQEFESKPKHTEVNPGSDALLECRVLNKVGSCIWQKDRKVIK
jgi:hypothetical protein